MALRAAQRLAPDGVTVEPVEALRHAIRSADALLIVSPEYNFSIPGVLKNALDWSSRPPDQPFQDKPVALMGASPGLIGTARMQYHLRQCFVLLDARVLNKPEVMIATAARKFDASGDLIDEATEKQIRELLQSLAAWTRRLAKD
jgi:chromate reductase